MTPHHALAVRPVRFTDQVDRMRDLLVLLGLRPRLESERGGWVDLDGATGMVALHDAGSTSNARPGETRLSFECADAPALAARLRAAGFGDAAVVDEAYGRSLMVTDPLGVELQLDERSDDLYGYRRHAATPSDVEVVVVCATARVAEYAAFIQVLDLADGAGRVQVVAGEAETRLDLVVPDLDAVEARLRDADLAMTRTAFLDLTDVDGRRIRVHARDRT